MIGMLAASKAGHDRAGTYMIVGEDEAYVYLCDGRSRPLERPKKKNKKHIQIIKKGTDQDIRRRLMEGKTVYNEEIKFVIKQFNRQSKEVKDV